MNTFAYLWQYLAEYFLEWEMFQIKFIEKNQHRHLMPDNFFFSKNRAVYETMSKNMVKPNRPQMTIWRIRVTCCSSKATRAQAHARARAPTVTHGSPHICTRTQNTRGRIPPSPHVHTQKYVILHFHSNNGFVNVPQCYVTRTLPVLSHLSTFWALPRWQRMVTCSKHGHISKHSTHLVYYRLSAV